MGAVGLPLSPVLLTSTSESLSLYLLSHPLGLFLMNVSIVGFGNIGDGLSALMLGTLLPFDHFYLSLCYMRIFLSLLAPKKKK